jgi:hypothetical protein
MDSTGVLQSIIDGTIAKVEDDPHYEIYDCVVKQYPAATFFVQSSVTPINLGNEATPFINTEKLWQFIGEHDVPRKDNTPGEVYLFNWVDRAQGPMIFDVGTVVEDDMADIENEHGFLVKRYPPMKFASIIYLGPFPHQPNTGWGNIHWEQRARDKGLIYTERLYRELYHVYDFEENRHVTEIQLEIE